MMMKTLGYVAVVGVLISGSGCGRTNNAVGENRPDGAAVNRAAQVTNSSDNKDPNPSTESGSAGTSGTAVRSDERTGAAPANALTATVQAKLMADPSVNARNIKVDNMDGVITLSGTVLSKGESDKAEQLARGEAGVQSVVNHLKVEPGR